jgi:hypothetical protein
VILARAANGGKPGRIFTFDIHGLASIDPPANIKSKDLTLEANWKPNASSTPELVADRIITFAEVVGQENVIAGTDRGLVTLRMRFREPGLACAQISISIDDRFELLNDRLAEGIHYKRFRRKSFFLMVFSVCSMPRLLVAG